MTVKYFPSLKFEPGPANMDVLLSVPLSSLVVGDEGCTIGPSGKLLCLRPSLTSFRTCLTVWPIQFVVHLLLLVKSSMSVH